MSADAYPFPFLLGCLVAVTLAAGVRAPIAAAAAAEPVTDQPAAPTDAAAPTKPAIAYRVTVDAPAPLKDVLTRDVGLVRWQNYADMTEDLLDRLMREATDETRNAAAAEGYFSAVITVTIDRKTDPAAVTLAVVPGEPTRIDAVRISVSGPAATDVPLGIDAIAKVTREWGLPHGEIFRQPAWTAAKDKAVATLAASPYAAAKLAHSEALIDPAQRSAELSVDLDSGPPFRFGAFDITGLTRYPPSVVRNFNTIRAGDPYSEKELEHFVRRLNASGYFASVQAAVDPATTHPEDATVAVAVIEGPTKRFEGGVGYSTDVQFRANASYRDVNIDDRGLQMFAEARLESKVQTLSLRFAQPPNVAGWIATYSAGAARTDIESLITRTAFAGTRWHTVEERHEQAVSATFYLDEQEPSGAPAQNSHALYPEYERYWRHVDNLIAPTTGWMAVVHAGGGIPGASTRGFGRVVGRFSAWVPLDRKTDLQFRAEGGAVLASSRTGIPSVLLFRTGGDNTVRGYAFESLGVEDGDAVVPGRYYGVANVDAVRWIGESWGLAAFVDAGNATDSLSAFRLALGYGIGARVRTPLGPFRLDVAYGQDVHKVRVHFSVGLTF
jgi:translocation and assembly module TamA